MKKKIILYISKVSKEYPIGIFQRRNDFGRIGYDGPCPSKRHGIHHYHFTMILILFFNLKGKKKTLKKL